MSGSASRRLTLPLLQALEDLSTRYDRSVRNSTGGVVQFTYGDDGLDPAALEAENQPVEFLRTWQHTRVRYWLHSIKVTNADDN